MVAPVDPSQTVSSAGSNPGVGVTKLTRITVLHGPSAGLVLPLEQGQSLVIGRQTDAAFPIADVEMSKQHARIDLTATGAVVVDLGSRNGTFLEGARCHRAPLVSGNVLRVGASLLLWEEVAMPSFFGLQTSCGGVQPISRPPARVRVAPRSHPATRSLALCAAR